jgi:hypothetical protein
VLRAAAPSIEIVDYRRDPAPRRMLRQLQGQPGLQVWSEAEARAEVAGLDRYELGAAGSLVIWTAPPGPAELRAVLEKTAPARVYLFGVDPGLDEPDRFLKRLAGLTKRALSSSQGRVCISTLAAATAQREVTVRAGLAWLVARGHLVVSEEDDDEVHLVAGDRAAGVDLSQAAARLKDLLEETAAYRAHFARAEKESLVSFQ